VREVAGGVLQRLVSCRDPHVITIPDVLVIQESLKTLKIGNGSAPHADKSATNLKLAANSTNSVESSTSVTNWTKSNYVFSFLVNLLDSKYYFNDIISGMVISIGGLSEDIVKDSLSALMKWCLEKKATRNLRDLGYLSNAVINIFNRHLRNSRVTVPLMKCISSLLRSGVFDFLHCNSNNVVSGEYCDKSASFGDNLLRCVSSELNNCGDLVKMRSGIDIYLLLLLFEDPVRPSALKSLILLLGHRYPKVRKYTAELLYVQFISDACAVGPGSAQVKEMLESKQKKDVDDKDEDRGVVRSGFAVSQELLDAACEVLTCTVWDGELEAARANRAKLCDLLGVILSIKTKAEGSTRNLKEKKADELDSYDALVRDAGY